MKARIHYLSLLISIFMPATLLASETSTDTQVSQANNLSSKPFGVLLSVPKFLVRNVNDDQTVSQGGYERWDRDHCPSYGDKDLKAVTVTGKAGPSGGTLSLIVTGKTAAITSVSVQLPSDPPVLATSPSSSISPLIYWLDDKKTTAYTEQQDHLTLTWILGANESHSEVFYIEGVENSNNVGDIQFVATITTEGQSPNATGQTTVYEADLDVDSNNDDGIAFNPGSDEEDRIEASKSVNLDGWPIRPGKFIVINNGDSDGIADWADGFNVNPAPAIVEDDQLFNVSFVPMQLEKKGPFSDECEVFFEYDAADPKDIIPPAYSDLPYTKSANSSSLRIWKKDAGEFRNKEDISNKDNKGDYVPSNIWIKWKDLQKSGNKVKLYIESIMPSAKLGDLSIKITIRENKVVVEDEVIVTSLEFVSEPISSKDINRAGLINGGAASSFECEIYPQDYPDSKIVWKSTGACAISGSNIGKSIKAAGTGSNADFKLIPVVEGLYSEIPEFNGKSLDLKMIDVIISVVSSSAGATPLIDDKTIDDWIIHANKIYRQAAIEFRKKGATKEIVNPTWFTSLRISDDATVDQLQVLQSTEDAGLNEVEVYFIKQFSDSANGWTITNDGLNIDRESGSTIAVGESGTDENTFAHELGHAFKLKDIYYSKNSGGLTLGQKSALIQWNPRDWNSTGLVSPRYYREGRQQKELIKRALMHGSPTVGYTNERWDIPLGTMHGFHRGDNLEIQVAVGIEDLIKVNRVPQE